MNARVFVFACAALAALPAFAQPTRTCQPIGRIETVESGFPPTANDGAIIPDGGGRGVPIRPREPLFAGDRIVVREPSLRVRARLAGVVGFALVDARQPSLQLPGRSVGCSRNMPPWTQRSMRSDAPIPVNTRALRSDASDLGPSAALPVGRQWLPRGMRQLALVWRGGGATVSINRAAAVTAPANFAVIPTPGDPVFELAVRSTDGRVLMWSVSATGEEPPRPEGWPQSGPLDGQARVERALWLLNQGQNYPEWRLFALSELAAFRTESVAADAEWARIVGG